MPDPNPTEREEDARETDAPGADARAADADAAAREAAERARRYLDLWERNLAQLAVHGPGRDRPGGS